MESIRYGPLPDQEGDLYLPSTSRPPVVCLLHGGFWRMPHGRDQMAAIAENLVSLGFAVWNLGYRRLGAPQSGWPATMSDVAAGMDHLAEIAAGHAGLNLDRVAVVGHSAGGQLAFWSAARDRVPGLPKPRIGVAAAVGLAPIADLAYAYDHRVGGEVVAELLGGTPSRYPERRRAASPIDLLPLGVRQLILHDTSDAIVPIEISRRYARKADAAGDTVQLVELSGTDPMDFLNPSSDGHGALSRWLSLSVGP